MFFYLFICFLIFAIGDFLGVLTKARLSSVFVALMLFLVGFLTGILPKDIISQAGLTEIGAWSAAFVVFNMGTSINFKELVAEWRTVVLSIISMLVALVSLLAVAPILGKEASLVTIPIINGGFVSTKLMTEAAAAKGLPLAAGLGMIVYAVQKFVGTIPASAHGLKEAEKMLVEFRANKNLTIKGSHKTEEDVANKEVKQIFYEKHDKYFTNFVCLAIVAFFAWVATTLGNITPISYSIWALLLGAFLGGFGLIPPRILDKGKATGLFYIVMFSSLIPALAQINLSDLFVLGWQTVVIFVAVMVGIYIFMYLLPTWKIVGSRDLSVGIAMAQLLGFPATLLIANEIATAVAQTPEEKEHVLDRIMPAYVISGFVTVTSLSIIMAGILVKFL